MKRILRKMSSLLMITLFILISTLPMAAFADTYHDSSPNDMITEVFNTDIEATSDNCFHIRETITVDYVAEHHGIFRYVPYSDDYEISNVEVGGGYNYTVESDDDNNNLMIKIGSSSKYLTGKHTYEISYDIDYYKDTDPEIDRLNLDLLPTGWDTSIRESSMHLTMPYDVDWSAANLYYGKYGTSDFPEDKISVTAEGRELTLQASDLEEGCGVTVDASLPDNYWKDASYYYERHPKTVGAFLLLTVAAAALAALFWFLFGRDKYKLYRPVTVRPPRGLTPLEVGHYINDGANNEDVISMLFYYANKGYFKIRQIQTDAGIVIKRQKDTFELVKVKSDHSSEKEFSQKLIKGISKLMKGNSITLEQFNDRLQAEGEDNFISEAKSNVAESIEVKNEGENVGWRLLVAVPAMLAIILAGFIAGPGDWMFTIPVAIAWAFAAFELMIFVDLKKKSGLVLGLIVGVIVELVMWLILSGIGGMYLILMMIMIPVTLFFLAYMESPSEEYLKLMGEIYGFRDYIKKVDEPRLRVQLEESPDYFYDILPYAVVFGLESKWSKQFTDLGIEPSNPSWYDSTAPFVYSTAWTNNIVKSVNDSFHVNTDSGSDGGGGGGFSGGGGGGGGGGGW